MGINNIRRMETIVKKRINDFRRTFKHFDEHFETFVRLKQMKKDNRRKRKKRKKKIELDCYRKFFLNCPVEI